MKFTLSVEFLVVVVLFIGIMFLSTYGSTKVTPFEPVSNTLKMYPYQEGLETGSATTTMPATTNSKSSSYASAPLTNSAAIAQQILSNSRESFDTLASFTSELNSPTLYNPISQLSSSNECVGISSGLSNSKGGLCFTPEVKDLLKTRGKNANITCSSCSK